MSSKDKCNSRSGDHIWSSLSGDDVYRETGSNLTTTTSFCVRCTARKTGAPLTRLFGRKVEDVKSPEGLL